MLYIFAYIHINILFLVTEFYLFETIIIFLAVFKKSRPTDQTSKLKFEGW